MTTFLTSHPVRVTFYWQAGATLIVALVALLWSGVEGAISAALGGLVTVVAGIAYAAVISIKNPRSADSTVVTMFIAEGAKIGAIILLLWAVIASYRDLVSTAFFAAFVVTVLLNRVAFLVRAPDAVELDKSEWK
jgi:ATP synthase protein I